MNVVVRSIKYVCTIAIAIALLAGRNAAVAQKTSGSDLLRVGDKVLLVVETPMQIYDTLAVRDGMILTIPKIGDISVAGVRRRDAATYLKQQLGKYVRDPVVKVVVLLRVGVYGAVLRPSYIVLPSDMLLSDALTYGGGLSPNADPTKIVVKRDGREVIGRDQVNKALQLGSTLDDIGVNAGDVITVGEKSGMGFQTYLQIVSVALGIVVAAVALSKN